MPAQGTGRAARTKGRAAASAARTAGRPGGRPQVWTSGSQPRGAGSRTRPRVLGVRREQATPPQPRGVPPPAAGRPQSRCPHGPEAGARTLQEALLLPGGLTERGRRDEDDAAARDAGLLQVPHHAL